MSVCYEKLIFFKVEKKIAITATLCYFANRRNTSLGVWLAWEIAWAARPSLSWQRPYHAENTSSRPIPEVKQHWARLVLGWETAWEPLVSLSFFLLDRNLQGPLGPIRA